MKYINYKDGSRLLHFLYFWPTYSNQWVISPSQTCELIWVDMGRGLQWTNPILKQCIRLVGSLTSSPVEDVNDGEPTHKSFSRVLNVEHLHISCFEYFSHFRKPWWKSLSGNLKPTLSCAEFNIDKSNMLSAWCLFFMLSMIVSWIVWIRLLFWIIYCSFLG